ncbi:hypothetical protein AUK18_01825 [Candidatus Beckwithbacteria bacterium CG2_30_44_31]|uniref:DUF5678 domain-containing protein n=1 Tax=Candidatus Beckwithbacteria bacterium CG2_30_44_31 TaxID=1805035 RepID=A0A1J5B689_9BACT|nr:MAG: hypothetical protein AUK18_01825 [Candidatus Beckwithbacteria bacterium CG2_30_44_31]
MKTINLKKTLAKYQSGWVAINKNFKVVGHAKNFRTLADRYELKHKIVLMPASSDYSGLVTRFHG